MKAHGGSENGTSRTATVQCLHSPSWRRDSPEVRAPYMGISVHGPASFPHTCEFLQCGDKKPSIQLVSCWATLALLPSPVTSVFSGFLQHTTVFHPGAFAHVSTIQNDLFLMFSSLGPQHDGHFSGRYSLGTLIPRSLPNTAFCVPSCWFLLIYSNF